MPMPIDEHRHHMSHRICITISREHYLCLDEEADRSAVSIAELVRRALDTTYGPAGDRKVVTITHSLGRRTGRPIG
jgi:hypothetical protein